MVLHRILRKYPRRGNCTRRPLPKDYGGLEGSENLRRVKNYKDCFKRKTHNIKLNQFVKDSSNMRGVTCFDK